MKSFNIVSKQKIDCNQIVISIYSWVSIENVNRFEKRFYAAATCCSYVHGLYAVGYILGYVAT